LIPELPEKVMVILRDFHPFLEEANPVLVRAFKDRLRVGKTQGKTLILLGCRLVLPPELEREVAVLHFMLPTKPELAVVLDNLAASAQLPPPVGEERDLLLDAASGLTSIEAENAFALSVVEAGKLVPAIVAREKANEVKKNGLLEICPPLASLEDIGGLDQLKQWLLQRQDAFGQEASRYGLPSPKGLLIVGIPGSGKSLTAKATASVFGRPLLKLDAGKLYGSLVGQSEGNLRSVIQVAEAIAPCILFIDELEKGFAGSKSSGSTDGGTSARVFGSFISWMQEKQAPVFVVATANDVSALPPELLRRGRFDECFFVDLPNREERRAIWDIQIRKHGRKAATFDLRGLVEMSEGMTGAEIEQAFIDSLYAGFADGREPDTGSVCAALAETVPLSKLMAEQIQGLRKWAQGRARPATSKAQEGRQRKMAAC
jgi:AAA+ superfamily predicted ATPase